MKELNFKVIGQNILPSFGEKIVADSKNYFTMSFDFSDEWKNFKKTAVITINNKVYNCVIDNNGKIKADLLPVFQKGALKISVYGGDFLVTEELILNVHPSGYKTGVTPPVVPPDIYSQLTKEIYEKEMHIESMEKKVSEDVLQTGRYFSVIENQATLINQTKNHIDNIAAEVEKTNTNINECANQVSTNKNAILQKVTEAENSALNAKKNADAALLSQQKVSTDKGIVETNMNKTTAEANRAKNEADRAENATSSKADITYVDSQLKLKINLPSNGFGDIGQYAVSDGNGGIFWVGNIKSNNWIDIQNIVKAGIAPKIYPVGYEFVTHNSLENTDIIWRVVAHNTHKAVDNNIKHTMTLETKNVYSDSEGHSIGVQYSERQALYYAKDGLAVGTYNFTVANQEWFTTDNGKNFQFTITKPIPKGGQIVLNITYSATLQGKSIRTYNSLESTKIIETATLIEGSQGTNLGITDGTGLLNHMHRIIFGSNNYAQSSVRQLINSDYKVGSVWKPATKFDRPPSWVSNGNSFIKGLPTDFLQVVQSAVVPFRTNSTYEVESLNGEKFSINQVYNLHDKFFLLSRPEIFGTLDSDSTIKDGEFLEYYNGLTDAERIKYDVSGLACSCRLRSPNPGSPSHEYSVNINGTLGSTGAINNIGIAPACIIG